MIVDEQHPATDAGLRAATHRSGGWATTAALRGELDSLAAPAVRDVVAGLFGRKDQSSPVVLDLTEVSFLDCGGVGALVEARSSAQSVGRRLALVGVQPAQRRLLDILGLSALLGVREGEAAQTA